MKTTPKKLLVLLAAGLFVCGFLSQSAQAVPIASGSGNLVSQNTPGSFITVQYSVDLTGSIYTYMYTLVNPVSNTTSIDTFSISFANPAGTTFNVMGGSSFSNTNNGVTYLISPGVAIGTSQSGFSFQSNFGPSFANATASDSVPPSPWASTNGGQQILAPNVPDGGVTVALLGLACVGLALLRRKLSVG